MIKNENLVNKFKTLKSNQRLSLFLSSCIKKPHKTKSIIATAKLSNKGNKNKDAKSNQTTKHVVLSESVNLTASQCINIFSLFPSTLYHLKPSNIIVIDIVHIRSSSIRNIVMSIRRRSIYL